MDAVQRPFSDEQIETLRRALARAVARACPRWLADRREDLVQVALIRVVDAWRKSERSGLPPHSYLVRAAFTAIAGELRALGREPLQPLEESVGAGAPAAPEAGPEQRVESREIARAIKSCLSELIASRRAATTLALAGYERERIARLLGVEVKKVDNDRHRGLADLRACLTRKGFRP